VTCLGIAEKLLSQALDFRRHGGREHQGLADHRQLLADFFNIGDEAHIQHAVGFVNHQHLDVGQDDASALEQVQQTARRGNQHINAAIQQLDLVVHILAADNQAVGQLVVLAVNVKILGDLRGQLPRRLQDQRARHAGAGAVPGEDVDHRQSEGSGFAGAGLGRGHKVAPHQHQRNGVLLNRGGDGIAHIGHSAADRLGKT
jgi:hypothetical protein